MITMNDIAEKAGVSRSTVSFVLNKRYQGVYVSDDTRERVTAAARALGYRRNELARAIVTGKNRVLGFLVCSPESEVVARMLAGALDEAEEQSYFIKVLRLRNNVIDSETIDRCVELRLAGVIVLYLNEERLDELHIEMERYNIPVATLDDSLPHPWGVRVISDDVHGCRMAIEHLLELGHRKIGLISGRPDSGISILRERGYHQIMGEAGLQVPPHYVAYGFWSVEKTEAVVTELLSAPDRPTALICAGDIMAMTACRTARGLGLRVPQDLSVVGFANIDAAEAADPPLTTVAQPFQEMGRMAVRRLLQLIGDEESGNGNGNGNNHSDGDGLNRAPLEESLPTHLVVRGSTAPIQASPAMY
jgi:LacI family transcriptional regulator